MIQFLILASSSRTINEGFDDDPQVVVETTPVNIRGPVTDVTTGLPESPGQNPLVTSVPRPKDIKV